MGSIFAGSEIVEIGIQIEQNGRDFYNTLARQSNNTAASGIFKYLAGEEVKHIAVFQNILSKAGEYEPVGLDAGQYFAYMNALAGEYVFTQKDKGEGIDKRIKSDKEAVDTGIGFEKDSIIFYEGMKKAVPEYDLKVIDELIVQEQAHLMQLIDLESKI